MNENVKMSKSPATRNISVNVVKSDEEYSEYSTTSSSTNDSDYLSYINSNGKLCLNKFWKNNI